MTQTMINTLVTQGGFAVLAAVCLLAIVQIVKVGVGQMEKSHLREMEALKLVASDRAEMIKQLTDLMLEVRSALVSLQDEIHSLHRALDVGGFRDHSEGETVSTKRQDPNRLRNHNRPIGG